jgi:ATP synthase protein I
MAGADQESGRNKSGRDGQDFRQRLDALEAQLTAAQGRHAPLPDPDTSARGRAMGQALRLATELIAGVVVGGFIGWALDRWLGTAPFLMVLFLLLGIAAGILNVVRTAKLMQAAAPATKHLPSVPDDDVD